MKRTVGLFLLLFLLAGLIAPASGDNGMPPFHFKDSAGNDFEYYTVGYLFLQETDMIGRYCGGSFTVIKKMSKDGWLLEASESDMPSTRTYYVRIPKTWDAQVVTMTPQGNYSSNLVKRSGKPPFRAMDCFNLIVRVTKETKTFTNTLDDTEDTFRVLELKAIVAQPCS